MDKFFLCCIIGLGLIGVNLLFAQNQRTFAILDFEARGVSAVEVDVLADRLEAELVNGGIVKIVERGQIRQILEEQDFQLSGCTSNECAVEIGQLLGVSHMVAGSIGKIGSTYSITIRTVHVGTGEITKSVMRDYRGEIDGLLAEMAYVARALANPDAEDKTPVPATPPTTTLVTPERDTTHERKHRRYPFLKLSWEIGDADGYLLFGYGWRITERTGIVVEISGPSFNYEEITASVGLSRFKDRKYTNYLLGFDSYAGLLFTIGRGLPISRHLYFVPSAGVSIGEGGVDYRAGIAFSRGF